MHSMIVCILIAWENNFPFEKESTAYVASSITSRGIWIEYLVEYSYEIPRSAPTPSTLLQDGTRN